jgi:hypothetical protein
MARSTQAQRAERVRAAQELLARGTSMVEAAVALSRDFGLSRRQAYRYLEEAQAVASPPVVAEASVTITLKIPSNIVRELRAYSAISGLTISEIAAARQLVANSSGASRRFLAGDRRCARFRA